MVQIWRYTFLYYYFFYEGSHLFNQKCFQDGVLNSFIVNCSFLDKMIIQKHHMSNTKSFFTLNLHCKTNAKYTTQQILSKHEHYNKLQNISSSHNANGTLWHWLMIWWSRLHSPTFIIKIFIKIHVLILNWWNIFWKNIMPWFAIQMNWYIETFFSILHFT